jgi:Aromatic-ring hydroxylase, C-terminal
MVGPVPPGGDKRAGYWEITAVDEPTSSPLSTASPTLDFNPKPGPPVSRNVNMGGWTASTVTGSTRDSRACAPLLRPDCYVAWATDTARPDQALRASLRDALVTWFGAPRPFRRNGHPQKCGMDPVADPSDGVESEAITHEGVEP